MCHPIVWALSLAAILILSTTCSCSGFLLLSNSFNCRNHPMSHQKRVLSTALGSKQQETATADHRSTTKNQLLSLISSTPANSQTPTKLTNDILDKVRSLEKICPTEETKVVPALGGNWELMWTTQDKSSDEWGLGPLRTWINPLENQSYSNNPRGRANPVLPQPIQDRLQSIGLVGQDESEPIRSSQAIDLKRMQVRNVVTFNLPMLPLTTKASKATLIVLVDFTPNAQDLRRVDVKFQSCRVSITNTPIDVNIPLGIIGPTGWLRTSYIDDTMRITRGHKGSVFVLQRPSKQT